MNLTTDDAATIAAYIRAERPDYRGPVFIALGHLETLHMKSAETHVAMAINFASGKWPTPTTKPGRAA